MWQILDLHNRFSQTALRIEKWALKWEVTVRHQPTTCFTVNGDPKIFGYPCQLIAFSFLLNSSILFIGLNVLCSVLCSLI